MLNRKKGIRSVEAEGFYHGTQETAPGAMQAELDAHFNGSQEKVQEDAIVPLKHLEARVATLKRHSTSAEDHWQTLETETKGMPPEIAMPLLASILASLAIGGEAVLLAPVMDGFGIGERLWQFFTACVLVLVSSGLLELSIRQMRPTKEDDHDENKTTKLPEKRDRYNKAALVTTILLTTFAFTFVFVLGWWRAEEMIYASSLVQGAWGSFLGQNQTLTRVCVILLTLGLPTFAAIAFDWGFTHLRYAWEWRKAKRAFWKFSKQLDETQKKLEGDIEKRDRQIAALEEQKKEWTNAYLENHEVGRIVGAQRQPLWQILVKIAAVTLLVLTGCFVLDPVIAGFIKSARLLIYLFVTLALSGIYTYYALNAWDRPTPLQLYKQRAIKWRVANQTPSLNKTVVGVERGSRSTQLKEGQAAS